ncbi:MAG: PD-(D/E)XK nuclease family protein [Polaromonas sp.]|nr:PD-(D/E)XK nuclease family protein [Polaromonas sp.]
MNIFDIFCYGNGRITETNMSSILGFILDPTASHGYGRSTMVEFLRPLEKQLKELIGNGVFPGLTSRGDGVQELIGRAGAIEIELEETFLGLNDEKMEKARTIDLIIRIIDSNNNIRLVVAIENKIYKESASDKNQLVDEYKYLRETFDKNEPIIFVYLTPKLLRSGRSEPLWSELNLEFNQLKSKHPNDLIASYAWLDCPVSNHQATVDDLSSTIGYIAEIAEEILHKEQSGLIDPASSHSNLLIRSMMRFIRNGFHPENFGSVKDKTDSGMLVNEAAEVFWDMWPARILKGRSFAVLLIGLINKTVRDCQLSLQESVVINYRSSKLRYVGFLTQNMIETVGFEIRNLKGRIFTLRCDGRTSNTVIEISFSRPQKMTMDEFRRGEFIDPHDVELIDLFEQSKTIALFNVRDQLNIPVEKALVALTKIAFDAAFEEI